jgi:hypothetical protein
LSARSQIRSARCVDLDDAGDAKGVRVGMRVSRPRGRRATRGGLPWGRWRNLGRAPATMLHPTRTVNCPREDQTRRNAHPIPLTDPPGSCPWPDHLPPGHNSLVGPAPPRQRLLSILSSCVPLVRRIG